MAAHGITLAPFPGGEPAWYTAHKPHVEELKPSWSSSGTRFPLGFGTSPVTVPKFHSFIETGVTSGYGAPSPLVAPSAHFGRPGFSLEPTSKPDMND